MNSRSTWIAAFLVIVVGILIGRWLGRSATGETEVTQADTESERPALKTPRHEASRIPKAPKFLSSGDLIDHDARDQGAIEGQRWLRFSDSAARDRFLKSLEGTGIAVLGSIDALNALRVAFLDYDTLAGLLDGTEDNGLIFPVTVPDVGTIQDDAIGFGRSLHQWLGLDTNDPTAGSGVRLAVLDTGVGPHSIFSDLLKSIELIALPDDLANLNGHGTAVASLIASELGLAPGASLLSIRVANDNGSSDSFTLAQGIIEAADAGVDIINISMGSPGDSSILRKAIEYAQEAGALIVASAGNEGAVDVAYPAAYEGVIAVGAVDANGTHLEFSNSGNVDISAPGLSILSAYPNDQGVLFTGTSASAPLVSAAIAYVMDTQNVTSQNAYDLLLEYANDSGAPGYDPSLGEGYIDIGRIIRIGEIGFTDAAIASNHVLSNGESDILQVTVENRGNTTLINAPVEVTTSSQTVNLNIPTLPAGKTQTFEIPLRTSSLQAGQEIKIDSTVSLSGGEQDLKPSNDRRVNYHTPANAP